jgi:hypothetical protein
MRLPVLVTGMIAYGHGDILYAHYVLNLYPSNLNHIVSLLSKFLRDLEDFPKFVSRHILPSTHTLPLLDALLEISNVCKWSLFPS